MKGTHPYISERNKLLLLSLLVGLGSGFAAVLLNSLIHLVKHFVDICDSGFSLRWLYLVLPGMGMLLSLLLLKFLVKDNIGHGVTKVLLAVSRNESRIKTHNMWSSMLTSSVTIGFGGSVGAEAPIVYTGAAIGSNIGRWFHLSHRNITVLLGCGAAGAIAGIFKAPLAGVLFTMEILMFNVSMNSMLPMLLSTVSATMVSFLFTGQTPVFQCALTPFSMSNIPFYIILGVVAGLSSLYFMRMTLRMEDRLGKLSNPYMKWGICALLLGLLIFLFPPLYGEGYDSLHLLLNGEADMLEQGSPMRFLSGWKWGIPVFLALVFLMKVFSMTFTNAGGGVGGTFGPTLFAGAILGFTIARVFNLLLAGTGISIPEQNFALVGMAALMAAVMQAPMTAIFLIAEITGGYALFIPLIIGSTISFATVRIFEKYSIYTKRIAQSGDLLTHDSDHAVLTLMKTSELVRDKYPRVSPSQTLGELVDAIADSTAAVIAVVDEEGRFCGMIDIGYVRKALFDVSNYSELHVHDLMESAPDVVSPDEKMESVMTKFDRTEAWRLPVLDGDGRYLGFISRSRVLTAYRSELKEITGDD